MDLGSATLIVAVVFSLIGVVVGIGIAKVTSKSKKAADSELAHVTRERIETLTGKIESLASGLKEKLESLKEENVGKLKDEVKNLIGELKSLKQDIAKVGTSEHAQEALDRIIKSLGEINYEVTTSNQALFTQINDSFLIVRNDLETILSRCKNLQKQTSELRDSLNRAVELARRINRGLVGSELLSLAATLRSDKGEIVKILDEQAINSKELVTVLENVRQRIGE